MTAGPLPCPLQPLVSPWDGGQIYVSVAPMVFGCFVLNAKTAQNLKYEKCLDGADRPPADIIPKNDGRAWQSHSEC